MKKILVSLAVCSSLVVAADEMTEKPLKAHSELGYVQTKGNTDTKAFNFVLDVKKEWQRDVLTLDVDGQYATDQGVETKNKYSIEADYGYKMSERLSLDYLVGYKSDKFSGFEYQFYTGPGAKYKAIDEKDHKLSTEANILYAIDQYEAAPLALPPVEAYKDDYASYKLKGVYDWQILENLKFQQELSLRGSLEQGDKYFVYSKTAFFNKINSTFSAGVSYTADYVNLPAEGKKKTDSTLAFNLILDY
ncbi:MAG: DUF481 domain-containing protein [Campylobacterales bacterium]|nr:DUF481 domain-containing protein [Campylobacterales bacterium]